MKHTKIIRTSIGLRDALFDEFDALKAGTSTPQRASAMAKLAVQIINSVKIEIEHQTHVMSSISAAGKVNPSAVLQLGTSECDRDQT